MKGLLNTFSDLLSLVYPQVCVLCAQSLHKTEEEVCVACLYKLPETNFHATGNNAMEKLFWGRVQVHSAAAMYYFRKGENVQQLVHALKYKGNQQLGVMLGKQYGHLLKSSPYFWGIDGIVPVPLHKARLRKRGYNQSLCFANGLSQVMQLPLIEKVLVRNASTATQTRKTRFSRWQNVESLFGVVNSENIRGKHLLLVDDVVTTGATLEACAASLLQAGVSRVSIATIAYTENN